MRTVHQGEIYRHFKNKLYQIVAVAYHSETKEKFVVYQALYGDFKTYIRPYDMFLSEVDHAKYPEVKQQYRFELVNPEAELEESCIPHQTSMIEKIQAEDTTENSPVADTSENSPTVDANSSQENINPILVEFLDQETANDKIEYLRTVHTKLTDRLINDMAVSMDLTVDEGDLEIRYNSLLNCLRTMARFECKRLR